MFRSKGDLSAENSSAGRSPYLYESCRRDKTYLSADGRLGSEATNLSWIESGRVVCEHGIYSMEYEEIE